MEYVTIKEMKKSPLVVAAIKIILAATTVAAIIQQMIWFGQGGVSVGNFLSYFTIQVNAMHAAILLLGGLWLLRAKELDRGWTIMRGIVAAYMVVLGVVFWLLLADFADGRVPWTDLILHTLMPIYAVVDWLIDPPVVRLRYRLLWLWTIYPIGYFMYTLARGAFVNWYPYAFLDPTKSSYGNMALMVGSMLGFSLVVGLVLIAWNRFRTRET